MENQLGSLQPKLGAYVDISAYGNSNHLVHFTDSRDNLSQLFLDESSPREFLLFGTTDISINDATGDW